MIKKVILDLKSNYDLPFKLLCDKHSSCEKIRTTKRFFWLISGRITFLLNSNNEILFIYKSSLKMKSHIDEVLKYFENNLSLKNSKFEIKIILSNIFYIYH